MEKSQLLEIWPDLAQELHQMGGGGKRGPNNSMNYLLIMQSFNTTCYANGSINVNILEEEHKN